MQRAVSMALLAGALAVCAWVLLRGTAERDGAARRGVVVESASEAAHARAPDEPLAPAGTRREPPREPGRESEPSTTTSAAQRGSLAVHFTAREPLDRLHVVVRGEDRALLDTRSADADRIEFADLPTGSVHVELSGALGKPLANGAALLRAGEVTQLTLAWPAPLPDRRRRSIRGEVRVPFELLIDHPLHGAQLELMPLLDSEEQTREATAARHLRVDRLAYGEAGARRFAFEGLPTGSYELRLRPMLEARKVTLTAADLEIEVRLDCGPVGRALLNFEDAAGETLRPRSVRARPTSEDRQALHAPVPWNERHLAYDFAAVSGEYDLELQFEDRPGATLRWTLAPGWSEHRLRAPSHGPIEVQLRGAAQEIRRGDFSATPQGDGRVLSLRLVRTSASAEDLRLELTVDRVGPYRIDFEREGRRRQSIVVTASSSASDAGQSAPVVWTLE